MLWNLIIYSCIIQSLSQGADFVTKGDGFEQKHKTEVKYACSDEHNVKVTMTNKDAEAEWEFAPASMNKDGREVTMQVDFKAKPPNGESEGKVEAKCGGYELGPLKGWSEVSHYGSIIQNTSSAYYVLFVFINVFYNI